MDRAYYVGTSSLEEILSIEQCCTFRGSFSKLDIQSGKILWQTFILPDNHGKRGEYAGAAIWGSSPSIDVSRNHIYIATGNLYSAPLHIRQCQEKENNSTRPTHPDECVEPENLSESILALDLKSGEIEWYHQLGGYDVWFLECGNLSTPNCPPGPNPDADFGEAPMMLTIKANESTQDVVVAVQKSGLAWALHRDDGKLMWSTVTILRIALFPSSFLKHDQLMFIYIRMHAFKKCFYSHEEKQWHTLLSSEICFIVHQLKNGSCTIY